MIYVVMGTTGEYSDRDEWPVAAYRDGALAAEHVVRAEQCARAAQADKSVKPGDFRNPYDPENRFFADYYVWKVPLLEALPSEENPLHRGE